MPLVGANKCVNLMAGRDRDFQRLVFLIKFCVISTSGALNALPQVTLCVGLLKVLWMHKEVLYVP